MLSRIIDLVSDAGAWLGQAALVALALVTVSGVVLRSLRISTANFYELITIVAVFVFVCGWGYVQRQKAHLRVFFLISRLPHRVQLVIDAVVQFLSVGICSLMVWYSVLLAHSLWRQGNVVSVNLRLPVFPLVAIIAFSIMIMDVALAVDLYRSLVKVIRGDGEAINK